MLRALFVLSLLGAGFAGSLWSRHVALLTYIWIALFRPFQWIYLDLNALRPSLLAGLLLLIPCLVTGQFPNVLHPLSILMWLFTGTVIVAQLTSTIPGDWAWVDQFVRLVVVSSLAVTLLNTRDRLMHYIAVIAGSIAFFSAKAGIAAIIGGGVRFSAGQAGSFVDNNGYALAISMSMPLMAAAAAVLRLGTPLDRAIRAGFLIAIPLSVLTVIGTMSRSGLLAVGTLALAWALLYRRPVLATASVVLAALLTYNFAPMPEGYLERMETIQTYDEIGEVSALSRLHFWRVAVDMASENPLGVGLRKFDTAYDRYDTLHGTYGRRRSVHSSHFQALAEMGYLGFALWVCLFGYAVAACLHVRFAAARLAGLDAADRRFYITVATAFVVSMAAFVVGGAFIALANNDLTWLTFAGVAALQRQFLAQRASLTAPTRAATVQVAAVVPRRAAIA
jgi:putative inorganic carbon (HCO3(-)) transporter